MHIGIPSVTLLLFFLLLLVGGFFFWPAWLIAVPILGLLVIALVGRRMADGGRQRSSARGRP
jgi:hypothetical protein